MKHKILIEKIKEFVKNKLTNSESGHDYWHSLRVLNNVRIISKNFKYANKRVLETAALIHDLTDHKFDNCSIDEVVTFLRELQFSDEEILNILYLVKNVSFSNENKNLKKSVELMILQDSDRLDAIGAIGIARAFSYGGFKKREFYNPYKSTEVYENELDNDKSNTIEHFYEKLLLLKNQMNTKKGKKLAKKRHRFMKMFLKQFYKEWGRV